MKSTDKMICEVNNGLARDIKVHFISGYMKLYVLIMCKDAKISLVGFNQDSLSFSVLSVIYYIIYPCGVVCVSATCSDESLI